MFLGVFVCVHDYSWIIFWRSKKKKYPYFQTSHFQCIFNDFGSLLDSPPSSRNLCAGPGQWSKWLHIGKDVDPAKINK